MSTEVEDGGLMQTQFIYSPKDDAWHLVRSRTLTWLAIRAERAMGKFTQKLERRDNERES